MAENYSTSSSTTDGEGARIIPTTNIHNDKTKAARKSYQTNNIEIEGTLEAHIPKKKEFGGTNFLLRKCYAAKVKRAVKATNKPQVPVKADSADGIDIAALLDQIPQMQEAIRILAEHGSKQNTSKKSISSMISWLRLGRKDNSSQVNKSKTVASKNNKHQPKQEQPAITGNTAKSEDLVAKLKTILNNLEDKPDLSYSDPLNILVEEMFFSTFKENQPHNKTTTTNACALIQTSVNMINFIVQKSAGFLAHVHAQEVELLLPRAHYRALTNYWVYCLIEWIVGPSRHNEENNTLDSSLQDDPSCNWIPTPASYAYVLLYPYTDDILDDETTEKSHKKMFIANIFKIIEVAQTQEERIQILPQDFAFASFRVPNKPLQEQPILIQKEQRVYDLIDVLLDENTSDCFLASLRNVNAAQMESMKQKRPLAQNLKQCALEMTKKERDEIWDISVRKGAAACFPVAYLLYRDGVTAEEADIIAILGGMGQHLNDIEGIFDDMEEKSLTAALISYFRHDDSIDRYVDRVSAYLRTLLRTAPKRFPTLPLDRLLSLLSVMQIRLFGTSALLHERSLPSGILTKECIQALEHWLRVDMKYLAEFAKAEQELCGGVPEQYPRRYQGQHQLSSPRKYLAFVKHILTGWMHIQGSGQQQETDKDLKTVTRQKKMESPLQPHVLKVWNRKAAVKIPPFALKATWQGSANVANIQTLG